MFAGFMGIAFAATKGMLRLCTFTIGIGGGAVNGATNALVSDISKSNKGADLSLLGVFFGIGAMGMPLLLGILRNIFSFEKIIAAVAILTIVTGVLFMLIKFPPPKQPQSIPFKGSISMLKDLFLIFIALYLFLQSSFEGIINNWTTTYLTDHLSLRQDRALYALSAYVAGMTVMRLMIGSFLRRLSVKKLLLISFMLIPSGLLLLTYGGSAIPAVAGLFLTGSGLAAGFPAMLGLVGDRYAGLSGTAFSMVLVVALTGNISVNYGMGIIAQNSGIQYLTAVAFIELFLMILLSVFIFRKIISN
jgi:fucose permease